MYREQHGEYACWYLGVKRSWLTFMASIAYSTWKRRPSGEKVLTPLKKNIFAFTVFITSYPFTFMGWQMVKFQILKRQTNIWKVRDWDLSTHNYEPFIQGVKRYNELQESAVLGFQSLFFFCYWNTSAKFSKSNNYTKTLVTNNE